MGETALKAVITKPGEAPALSLAVPDDGYRELDRRDVELWVAG